jgi:hypothetical protein
MCTYFICNIAYVLKLLKVLPFIFQGYQNNIMCPKEITKHVVVISPCQIQKFLMSNLSFSSQL